MEKAIGVIGGVGPYAGVDLVQKIFDNTIATKDQDHLPLYLINYPSLISDRTTYLLEGGENPAYGLFICFEKLALLGVSVVAIPCNTAHAPPIFNQIKRWAAQKYPSITLLNMIEECGDYLAVRYKQKSTIGLMATVGTHTLKIYQEVLQAHDHLTIIEPDKEGQKRVHQAIYNSEYGIKSQFPITPKAVEIIEEEALKLKKRGAQALILGCTELPLAFTKKWSDLPLIDPTTLLARAAIKAVAFEKLKEEH